jgi:uncharacterized protein (TIGR03067 family)
MTRYLVAWGVAALVLATGAAQAGERDDYQRLQGTWIQVEHGSVGNVGPSPKGLHVTVTDDKMVLSGSAHYVLKLNTTRTPREVDMTVVSDNANKPRTFKGIYKLEGDTFIIHFARIGDRPKNFTDGADGYVRVMKFQRFKQPKKE